MPIYDLDDIQYELLLGLHTSEQGKPAILVESNPRATLEERKLTEEYTKKATDLVELGFLIETSHEEKEKKGIEEAIERLGFGFRVFRITEEGRKLFDRNNLVVN